MPRRLRFTILALLCASVGSASAGVELNSKVTESTSPLGFKSQHFTFSYNGRPITYEAPRGWSPSGGGAAIKFTPPEAIQAQADITQSPLPAPQAFDEPTIKSLREKALATLPPESQQVEIISETPNLVILSGNQSYSFIISYQAFGQHFMTGLIYVHYPDTQLRFRTVARKADFEKIHEAFRASLFAWQTN